MMLVVDLDGRDRAHLEHALQLHRQWCSTNAVPFPPALRALLDAISASKCQERTEVAAALRDGDDRLATPPLLLGVKAAAGLLSVSVRQVGRLVASGQLRSVKVGGARRIDRRDIERFIEDRKEGRRAG